MLYAEDTLAFDFTCVDVDCPLKNNAPITIAKIATTTLGTSMMFKLERLLTVWTSWVSFLRGLVGGVLVGSA